MLKRFILSSGKFTAALSRVLLFISAGTVCIMMLLTAVDVILRQTINQPIMGTGDITEFMMIIIVAFALAYVTVMKEQINVDFIITRLAPRTQAILSVINNFVSFGIVSLLTWQTLVQIKLQYQDKEVSLVLEVPTYPFYSVLAFGLVVLSLVLLWDLFSSLYKAHER